jgi:hypothetical protein
MLFVLGAGTGSLPDWTSEYVMASDSASSALVTISALPFNDLCPTLCVGRGFVTVPANGTATAVPPPGSSFGTYIIGVAVPTVRARIYSSSDPVLAADLPVVRVKALFELNPDRLVFAIRPRALRTNLLLANVRNSALAGDDITVRIEVFSADGQQLASRDLVVLWEFGQAYVVDIGQFMGIPNPTEGQVRVTKISGGGVMWGILPSVNADGTISITLGATS